MRLAELAGLHVAVWGAGVEGAAAVSLLQRRANAASITVLVDRARETDPAHLHGVPVLDLSQSPMPTTLDAVLKSPGVSPYNGRLSELLQQRPDVRLFGGTALWFAEAAAANSLPLQRTIGVTGSKGKSTTASLIAHFLGALQPDVALAGNVGRAPLDVLDAGLESGEPFPADRWHVFELSSFQSAEVRHSPNVGVLTSLFPEHLDWHQTVERYFGDKLNLFAHPLEGRTQVAVNVGVPDTASWIERTPGVTPHGYCGTRGFVVRDRSIFDVSSHDERCFATPDDIPLTGPHNVANICGALTALRAAGFDPWTNHAALLDALRTFEPLAHRLQPVGSHEGRLVIDDSLSTAPQAAVAALIAFADRPVGLIVGGHDRGLDYSALAEAVAGRTQPLWVVGVPESGARICERIAAEVELTEARALVQIVFMDDFDRAVQHLTEVTPYGGVLLLSPAAPSFGRFRDYRDRGMHFRSLLGLL